MGEIIFKAKRKSDGEWIFGNYVNGGFIIKMNHANCIDIDENTVCQYTGLNDKNDCMIWLNDILKDNHLKYKVIWDEEEGALMCESVSGARYGIGTVNCRKFEVIGNVFDNPELFN